MIKSDNIKVIIDTWDPIMLLGCCPDDEYAPEIRRIKSFVDTTSEITPGILAHEIKKIFIKYFSTSTFRKSYEECLVIAEKILKD
jgi:hypothetical protein